MESFLGVEHQRSSPRLWIASCGMQLFPSGRPHKARPGGGMWTGWLALPVIHQGSLQDWIESFHSLLSLVLFPYVLVHFESSIMQHFLLFHFLKKTKQKNNHEQLLWKWTISILKGLEFLYLSRVPSVIPTFLQSSHNADLRRIYISPSTTLWQKNRRIYWDEFYTWTCRTRVRKGHTFPCTTDNVSSVTYWMYG